MTNENSYWCTPDSSGFTWENKVTDHGISLEEIPFDRDTKWINVPAGSRPRPKLDLSRNRLLKQVHSIAEANAHELGDLDQHYKYDVVLSTKHLINNLTCRNLDEKKKVFDNNVPKRITKRKEVRDFPSSSNHDRTTTLGRDSIPASESKPFNLRPDAPSFVPAKFSHH